jgi:hypothetical protein
MIMVMFEEVEVFLSVVAAGSLLVVAASADPEAEASFTLAGNTAAAATG